MKTFNFNNAILNPNGAKTIMFKKLNLHVLVTLFFVSCSSIDSQQEEFYCATSSQENAVQFLMENMEGVLKRVILDGDAVLINAHDDTYRLVTYSSTGTCKKGHERFNVSQFQAAFDITNKILAEKDEDYCTLLIDPLSRDGYVEIMEFATLAGVKALSYHTSENEDGRGEAELELMASCDLAGLFLDQYIDVVESINSTEQ